MSLMEAVIEGTLQSDGTLVLNEKPNLPAGRVTVVLRPATETVLPEDDPFWQRMQAMWAIPPGPHAGDGGAHTLAEVRRMREEWDEHQQAVERLQDEYRRLRTAAEETER